MAKKNVNEQQPRQRFMNGFRMLLGSKNPYEVWRDLMDLFSLSIINPVTKQMFEQDKRMAKLWQARENKYLKVIHKYNEKERKIIPQMFAMLVMEMEQNRNQDMLGSIYMELGISTKNSGQFFTPYSVCQCMTGITFDSKTIAKTVHEEGYVSVYDSACGAGATLIAAANECEKLFKKLNYQDHVYFVANDIDRLCCEMCYIQLSLLGVAGIVTCSDALLKADVDFWEEPNNVYFTPVYLTDVWTMRRMFHNLDIMMRPVRRQ